MSSPPSDLSWMSSSELSELQAAVDFQAKLPVWQNNWTPVNPPPISVTAAPFTLPSSQSDIDNEEVPSSCASPFREAILHSALRIKQSRKERKWKAPSTSPSSARKKRVANVRSEDELKSAVLPYENEKTPTKTSRAVEGSNPGQLEADDSLLPIRQSKLNIAASGHKRTSSEALLTDTDALPAKKTLLMTSVGKGTVSVATALVVEEQHGAPMRLLHPDKKYHFAAPDASNKDSQEDLFNDDNTDIENFLEAEKALAARATCPTPSPAASETSKTLKIASSLTETNATAPHKATMKPFVGLMRARAPPTATLPPGPLAALSASHPLPICFRIGDARMFIFINFSCLRPSTPVPAGTSFWPSTTKPLDLEIYAVVHTTQNNGASRTATLADLFFPDRPPYLAGTIVPQATSGATGSASFPTFSGGAIVRVIAQISPRLVSGASTAVGTSAPNIPSSSPSANTSAAPAGKYDIMFLKIKHSDWNEIQLLKAMLDRIVLASKTAARTPSVSTTSHAQKAAAAGARDSDFARRGGR